jgi:hypothetical protein
MFFAPPDLSSLKNSQTLFVQVKQKKNLKSLMSANLMNFLGVHNI